MQADSPKNCSKIWPMLLYYAVKCRAGPLGDHFISTCNNKMPAGCELVEQWNSCPYHPCSP
eukprot:1121318-Pelagomonas_calceolata.AAC.2